jgi:hypothetical protein
MGVAKVSGQFRDVSLGVDASAIPAQEGLNGESVTKIVQTGASAVGLAP